MLLYIHTSSATFEFSQSLYSSSSTVKNSPIHIMQFILSKQTQIRNRILLLHLLPIRPETNIHGSITKKKPTNYRIPIVPNRPNHNKVWIEFRSSHCSHAIRVCVYFVVEVVNQLLINYQKKNHHRVVNVQIKHCNRISLIGLLFLGMFQKSPIIKRLIYYFVYLLLLLKKNERVMERM